MKTKFGHRLAAFMLAGLMCITMLPMGAFAEEATPPSAAVTVPVTLEEPVAPAIEQTDNNNTQNELPEADDEDPLSVGDVIQPDLTELFHSEIEKISADDYYACMNALGWYSQKAELSDEEAEAFARYEADYAVMSEAVNNAMEFYQQMEDTLGEITDEDADAVASLIAMYQLGQYYFSNPVDPAFLGKGAEKTEDDLLKKIYTTLYHGTEDLPDYPTGYYISGITGLPVLTGETKASISVQTSGNNGAMDAAALANGDNSAVIPQDGNITILAQIEYPEPGSSYTVEVPGQVYSGELNDCSSFTLTVPICAVRAFDATIRYYNADGEETITKTLSVTNGEYYNSAAVGASAHAGWDTGSGLIGKSGYVGSVYVIGTSGGEALYCLDHGANGRAHDCPPYSASGSVYVLISNGWNAGAGFGTSAQVTNQNLIWAGTIASALTLDDAVPVTNVIDDRFAFILEHYPESTTAQLLTNTELLARRSAVSGTMYTPSAAGWQRVLAGATPTEIDDEDVSEEPAEYYAEWYAPPQTRSGSFKFDYGVKTDKVQLKTLEKVDGATIEIEPVEKSGEIDGGNWDITPADKQTVTTSGHTMDDSYQNNGGDAGASWELNYSVSKTSGSRNGMEGPYSSQEEADAAADSARDSAISELQAEAQQMVDNAIAAAKAKLATLKFRYDEVEIPYGFLAYTGSKGAYQFINVPANTSNDYLMRNKEWSLQINLKKVDSETGNIIKSDASYEIYEWDTVTQQYIPNGGYNQYSVDRMDDGTYAVINHSAYATSNSMQHTLYWTQRNEGKFVLVEKCAPAGYYGDWTATRNPGSAGSALGKRAYYVEITEDNDGSVIWPDNSHYSADIAKVYSGGTKLLTSDGETTTVNIYKASDAPAAAINYKNASRTYNTDNSRTAANEDSYTPELRAEEMINSRTLGEISLSKVDLDALRYVAGRDADGSAMLSGQSHGNAVLDGAIYDLYCAEDIIHPDGVTGVVDYSKIVDSTGAPIWHTTIRDNSGMWVSDYLPVLRKDHLVATSEIKDGMLTFANLYLGKYYIVERSTGVTIPVDNGYYKLSGTYPAYDARTKAATGKTLAMSKNANGEYTDWVYKGQFSTINQSKALDGTLTYDGYYISFAQGYLADEHNYYVSPDYCDESSYVEKQTFEDTRQQKSEQIDKTSYAGNYDVHVSNELCESADQVMKGNIEISKVISSTGQSNGVELENAGFTLYLISDLSKVGEFNQDRTGKYILNSILDAYINPKYSSDSLKYDFSAETQAIARCYEIDSAQILAYNRTLSALGNHQNGKGEGWVETDRANEYVLSEIFSSDTGNIRIQGIPYGQYLVVETTVPHDLYQAEPFILTVDAQSVGNPQSALCNPKDSVIAPSNSYQKFVVLDEEIETYVRLTKYDLETGKPVLLPNTAFQIYWLDDLGNYQIDANGHPKLVTMANTHDNTLPKNLDTFYTDAEGCLILPEKLPLGKYRAVEVDGPDGFYNEWLDTSAYQDGTLDEGVQGIGYLDFEITTDRAYQATGDDNEDGQDTLIIDEHYNNRETLGRLKVRKLGEVVSGFTGNFTYEERPLDGAEYTIIAKEDIYTQDRQLNADGTRTLWYAKGDTVAVITTGDGTSDVAVFAPSRTQATYDFLTVSSDELGEVSVTLPLGSYTVKETKPPYGFVGTDKTYDVTFTWENQYQEIINAAETFEYHNDREKGKVGIYKVDAETGKYLAGAVFELYAKDDIYDVDGKLIFKAGDLIETSEPTIADGYTCFKADIPIRGEYYGMNGVYIPTDTGKNWQTNSGNYTIIEKIAPAGYYLNPNSMEVTFTYTGEALEVMDKTCADKPTEMWVSKRDLTNDEELPGATLTITDMDGNVVREWVSGEEPTRITALHLDEPYILTETRPADGYALADSITFKLIQKKDDNEKLQEEADVYYLAGKILWVIEDWKLLDAATVVMKDDTIKVSISKTDIVTGEELPGAEIIIRDAEGKEVARWISEDTPHYIEKLPAGDYTLEEITAPDGYMVSEVVPFTVEPIGTIQSVTMKDAPYFHVDKVSVGGEHLHGAYLSIKDASGKVVDTWISGTNDHKVKVTGPDDVLSGAVILSDFFHERVYTLHEDAAPAGYALASDIQFKVVRDDDDLIVVYTRASAKDNWVKVDGKTITMIDYLKPTPEPTPEPTPVPTPAPTPKPVVTVPQTGDTSNFALMCLLLGASLAGIALCIVIYMRKADRGNDSKDKPE